MSIAKFSNQLFVVLHSTWRKIWWKTMKSMHWKFIDDDLQKQVLTEAVVKPKHKKSSSKWYVTRQNKVVPVFRPTQLKTDNPNDTLSQTSARGHYLPIRINSWAGWVKWLTFSADFHPRSLQLGRASSGQTAAKQQKYTFFSCSLYDGVMQWNNSLSVTE